MALTWSEYRADGVCQEYELIDDDSKIWRYLSVNVSDYWFGDEFFFSFKIKGTEWERRGKTLYYSDSNFKEANKEFIKYLKEKVVPRLTCKQLEEVKTYCRNTNQKFEHIYSKWDNYDAI